MQQASGSNSRFAVTLSQIETRVKQALGERLYKSDTAFGELTLWVQPADYLAACLALRDDAACRFEQLIDLVGMDYSEYGDGIYDGPRYAVVLHLLSVSHNQRVRLKVFAVDDDVPVLPSVTSIWAGANWYEREAFDLFGILFEGHSDLRRILTDYGFIGHPMRKDFPLSGHVEMRYDETAQRVIYQPVTIEPREITPRVIREEKYGAV